MARDPEEGLWVCEDIVLSGHSVFVILHLYNLLDVSLCFYEEILEQILLLCTPRHLKAF